MREKMSIPVSPSARFERVRICAMVWTGLSLLIGACTFISIYAVTGVAASSIDTGNRGIAPVVISQNITQTSGGGANGTRSIAVLPTLVLPPATNTTVPVTI